MDETPTLAWNDCDGEPERIAAYEPDVYSEIDHANGWIDEQDEKAVIFSDDMLTLTGALLRWISEPLSTKVLNSPEDRCRAVTVRLGAVIHAANLDLLPNNSLTAIGGQLGVTKQAIGRVVTQFRDQFPIKSRLFRSDAERENMKQAAIKVHQRKRKRALAGQDQSASTEQERNP